MRVFEDFRRQCGQAAEQFLAIVIHWPHLVIGTAMHACRRDEVNGDSVGKKKGGGPTEGRRNRYSYRFIPAHPLAWLIGENGRAIIPH